MIDATQSIDFQAARELQTALRSYLAAERSLSDAGHFRLSEAAVEFENTRDAFLTREAEFRAKVGPSA